MDRWKKQNKINWTWMMTDEILLTKLIVSRWLVFKSFTYIFIILHSASVCFSTTPSFQIPDTKKNAANIRAGSPLRVVTSSLMMLRRRPFPSAYSGLEWFRQAHEDRDIFCPGFWSEFLLQSFVALISFRRPTYSCGLSHDEEKKVVSHFMCLSFVLLNLSASFWSTFNVAKQCLLYNDRRWV